MHDKRVFCVTRAGLPTLSVYLGPFYVLTPALALAALHHRVDANGSRRTLLDGDRRRFEACRQKQYESSRDQPGLPPGFHTSLHTSGVGSDVDCCPAATTLSGCDSRLHGAGPSDDAGWFVKSFGTGIEIIFSQNDVQTIREWDDPVV
jgi:hypothetical protein